MIKIRGMIIRARVMAMRKPDKIVRKFSMMCTIFEYIQ